LPTSPTRRGKLDIEAAKQAISKSTNKDVRAFAEDMVRDHTAVNDKALALVKKLNVTPEDNDTSRALTKQAADKRAELSKLNGAEFDKAYIANEVAYHKTVNGALETTLIPSASNPELKSLLQTGLKIFQGHQQHAEEVAAALKKRDSHAAGTVSLRIYGDDMADKFRSGARGNDSSYNRQACLLAGGTHCKGRRHHHVDQ
jgi:putative membrane protein